MKKLIYLFLIIVLGCGPHYEDSNKKEIAESVTDSLSLRKIKELKGMWMKIKNNRNEISFLFFDNDSMYILKGSLVKIKIKGDTILPYRGIYGKGKILKLSPKELWLLNKLNDTVKYQNELVY